MHSHFLKSSILKRTALVAAVVVISAIQAFAQPSYYNTSTAGGGQAFPMNSGTNRVQWIYGPDAFRDSGSTGALCPGGDIDTIYLKTTAVIASPASYTDFTVQLSQNVGTDTAWNDTIWTTGSTHFYASSYSITAVSGDWIAIPLQTAFRYDRSKSLMVDISVSSGTGIILESVSGSANERRYGTQSGSGASAYGPGLQRLGLSVSPIPTVNLKLLASGPTYSYTEIPASVFCEGVMSIVASVRNIGLNTVDSFDIYYSIDDTLKGIYQVRDSIIPGASNGFLETIGSAAFRFGQPQTFKAWISGPGGSVLDSVPEDDTVSHVVHPSMSGKYTIGGSGSDYATIKDAIDDLSTFGICGPVEFELDSGTYTERLIIDQVRGVSDFNTIKFYGKNMDDCVLRYDADDSTGDWQTVLILNADYVELSDLTIEVLDSSYGIGVHVVASNYVNVHDLKIKMPVNQPQIHHFGICGSGDVRNAISPGNSGDHNTFRNIDITGGYYGLRYTGSGTNNLADDITVENVAATDYYRWGIYMTIVDHATITNNTLSSQLNADVCGMRLEALHNFECRRNRIFSVYEGLFVSFNNYYFFDGSGMSTIANNMVTTTGTWFPPFYNRSGKHTNIYHNNFLAHGQWGTEFRDIDSCDVINNIFASKGKSVLMNIWDSSKFYSSKYRFDHNVYHCPGSMQPVRYESANYSTISDWFTADTTLNKNSFIKDPGYLDSTDLHLTATSPPTGIYAGIDVDFDGMYRCLNAPTIGADEILQGTFPDSNNATYICAGDTLRIYLHPPRGLSGYPYDSLWSMDSWRMRGAGGSFPANFTFIPADSTHDGYFRMIPSAGEAGTNWELTCLLRDSTDNGCYESFGRYVKVEHAADARFVLNDSGLCMGDTLKIRLHDEAVKSTMGYMHDMGNGVQLKGMDQNYVYPMAGLYTITHYAYNRTCSDSMSQLVQIGGAVGARLDSLASQSYSLNSGTKMDPDVICSGGSSEYVYIHPDGFGDELYGVNWDLMQASLTTVGGVPFKMEMNIDYPSASNPLRIKISDTGQMVGDTLKYTVRIVSKANRSCEVRMVRYFVIGGGPEVSFNSDTACAENMVQFRDQTMTSGSGYLYDWDFGDGNTSADKDPMNRYTDTGSYTFTLRVRDEYRCWGEGTGNIRVHPLPNVVFDASGLCSVDPWDFTNQSSIDGVIDAYSWNFGDGYSSSQESPSHRYDDGGKYRVRLVASSQMGCIDSADQVVSVTGTPDASFEADTACVGESTQFRSLSADSLMDKHLWRFGDASRSGGANPLHRFARGGRVYNVFHRVTDLTGNCPDSVTLPVLVQDVPSVDFSISYGASRQVTFTPSNTVGYSFKWYFGDGDSSTENVPTHGYAQDPQTYLVRMQVTSDQECSVERSAWVDFRSAGISEEDMLSMDVWPNPIVRDRVLRVSVYGSSNPKFTLRDVYGRVLNVQFSKQRDGFVYSARLSEFDVSSGMYLLIIESDKGVASKQIRVID